MSRNQGRSNVKATPRANDLGNFGQLDQLFANAVKHHMAGEILNAEELYLKIMSVPPVQAEASYNLGLLYQTERRFVDAIIAYDNAIRMRPDYVDAISNMATAMQDLGHWDQAIGYYRKALALQPDSSMTYCNLGVALKERQQAEAAIAAYHRSIQIRPDYDGAFTNYAAALIEMDQTDASIAACRRALEINNQSSLAYFNLGAAFKAQNKVVEAEAAFRDALAVNPNFVEAHFTFSQVLLHQEKYAEGWPEYDWRWKLAQYSWLRDIHGDFRQPQWQGENIRGKTLLIYAEQGLGDAMQYVRYLPMVIEKTGANVILAVHPPLLELFKQVENVTLVGLDHVPLPPFDIHSPLISLPRLFGTNALNIPCPSPYLVADENRVAVWRDRLGTKTNRRVGIVWAGNPTQTGDRLRSPRLAAVQPLFDLPGITFVALQLGPGRDDMKKYPLPPQVIDLGPEIKNFADTAAIMCNLDLVISSCTAPLHLAAALGVPTWGMIPAAPHFIWQNDRSDSPWYPTLRLYRQAQPGADWSNVMQAITKDLRAL